MFSKILKSARAYIQPNNKTSQASSRGSSIDKTMVTPRTKLVQEEKLTDKNSVNGQESIGSAKRRRGHTHEEHMSGDDEFMTPSSKKRKVLPVRAKNAKSPKKTKDTRPVVEIPATKFSPELQFVEDEEEEDVKPEELKNVSTPLNHLRFSSEDPEQEIFLTARQERTIYKEDIEEVIGSSTGEEDSDDEAPEAIDTQEAFKAIKSKEKEAAQAVREQLNATRKKRKLREESLKKQSEGKKRKAEHASKDDVEFTKPVGDGTVKQLLETTDVRHDISDNLTLEKEFGAKVPRKKHAALDLEKTSLPEILPEEYLEDSDSMALVLQESLPNNKVMPKKTKFRDLLEKQQKDKRIGSTTYRITKVRNNHLPPKSASQARSIKESWLQGRSGKAINPDRKLISKGFFTK